MIREEQLGHLAEADDGRNEQPDRGRQGKDPVADGALEQRTETSGQATALGIAGRPARDAQELHALERRDGDRKDPAQQQR